MAGSIFANDDTGAITFLDGLNLRNPYRGSGAAVTSGLASSVVVNVPAGTQNNDGLLAAITFIQGTTVTPPAGWTAIDSSTGSSGVTLNTYYRVASSEPASYTWSFGTTTTATGTISRFVGINTTTMLDTFVSVNGQGSVTSVQPTKTLGQKTSSNLAVIFSGVRPDSGVTPVLSMPSSTDWNAPADAAATATGVSFPSVQGMSYKINGTTFTPTVTTNTACEFGLTTISINMASKCLYEADDATAGNNGLVANYLDTTNWTIGSTSAFPSNGPTNPGDGKLDYISTASAPTSGGVFTADLGTHSPNWDTDLATTEFSTGNFKLQPGDTVTATVTLGSEQGAWPAIWTWSSDNTLGGNNEVDLFEYHPDNPNLLELSNHVGGTTTFKYVDGIVTAGTPFDLRVYFGLNSCRWYVNNVLVFDDNKGVPSTWRANLIVNLSVSDGSSHPAPAGGQTHMQYTVANLQVLRSAGTAAETISLALSSSDTGSGVDANGNPGVKPPTDTGSGAEATTIATTLSAADTMSSVEATSIAATLSTPDTATGVDANTLKANVPSADTASGVDTSVSIKLTAPDTGSGLEGNTIATSTSDTGSGVDTNTALHAAMTSPDTASSLDNGVVAVTITTPDTVSSVEASQISVARTDSDTGAFVDSQILSSPVSSSDTVSSLENAVAQVSITSPETIASAEVSTVSVSDSDTGSSAEASITGNNLADADTGAFGEFGFATTNVADSDTGTLDDEGSGGFITTDTGVFAETQTYSATQVAAETGTFSEVSSTAIMDSDSIGAVETTALRVAVQAESVVSVEDATVRVAVAQADTGSLVDNGSIKNLVSSSDAISSTDNNQVFYAASDADTVSLSDQENFPLAQIPNTDTISSVESVASVKISDVDAFVSVDTEATRTTQPASNDTGTLVSETAGIRVSQSDTASAVENNIVRVSSSDSMVGADSSSSTGLKNTDVVAATELARIKLNANETGNFADVGKISQTTGDTVSAAEDASFVLAGIVKFSSDTAVVIENWSVRLIVADQAHSSDNHRIGVAMHDDWDPGEDAVISFNLSDVASFTEDDSWTSRPDDPETEQISFTETAVIRLLNMGAVPYLRPLTTPQAPHQPYYMRSPQRWAVDNERQRHLQALYLYGEWTMFVLMWHLEDHENGLVDRCHRCYGVPNAAQTKAQRIVASYNNVDESKCPDCFGTTFEGGFKAMIIRPAIFGDTDENQQYGEHGLAEPGELMMESTPDFRVRSGDYTFRSTGDRFRLRVPTRVTLRTGFATPYQRLDAIGYNHAKAAIEDETAVAYDIPPSAEDLRSILNVSPTEAPVDFSAFEIIRSPLIPLTGDQG